MNNYRKLFEQISPSESDEQLIGKVMARKAENMKENDTKKTTKRFKLRKAVIIPTAAALAIGAATLSVGAANNWDYSNPFKNMFAQKYEGNVNVTADVHKVEVPASNPASDPTSQDTASVVEKVDYTPERPIGTFDFEKYGKPLDIVMKGDGVTATLNGMLAYDSQCYIMYTTTATDEVIAKNGGQVPVLRIDFGNFGFKIDGEIASGMGYSTEPISEEGNTRTGLIKVHYSSADLSGKTLNITFLSETNNGALLLKETKDILVDFPIAENIEKELDLDLKTDSFDGKINKLTVGGFKASLDFEGTSNVPPIDSALLEDAIEYESESEEDWAVVVKKNPEIDLPKNGYDTLYEELEKFGSAVLTLKDGTTVVAKYDGMSSHSDDGYMTGSISLQYTYPLNPSDVVSVTFGDLTINL